MTYTLPTRHGFAAIEQLDEFLGELGWPIEYRQLEPGRLSSRFTALEGDSWFLLDEQSNCNIEAQAEAPSGMYVMALVEGSPAVVNGQNVSSSHIFFQSPKSNFRATLPAGIKITQVGIKADQFEEAFLAVQGDLTIPRGVLGLASSVPNKMAPVKRYMKELLVTPQIRQTGLEESISSTVTALITGAFQQADEPTIDRLHSARAHEALKRARDYIEAHLGDTIRLPSVCRYAGTTARSLERAFAQELGMPPQQYIKARRLNAVRRRLLAAEQGQTAIVTNLAQSFGFTHMGRFAQDYRLYFGESPRETVKIK